VGYGAAAVNPYLALEIIANLARRGELGEISVADALRNFRDAMEAGLKKILSKMGISTLASYLGGQFFEIIGLDRDVVRRFFPDTRSLVSGKSCADLAADALSRHQTAFGNAAEKPDFAGLYRFRKGFERHAYSPDVIRHLQKAARENDAAAYEAFAREVDQRQPLTLRDLLDFRFTGDAVTPEATCPDEIASRRSVPGSAGVPAEGIGRRGPVLAGETSCGPEPTDVGPPALPGVLRPVPLEEVEPIEAIYKRFSTQAMSLGALSPETQRTLAIAMNRLGAKSNTGEGGEDPEVYIGTHDGDWPENKIKQVASARFGVTPEYLVRAEQLEIKMAQGSKPGEGGQLPAHKVTPLIARVRRAVEGISLISPPPHHDIYSIEDLAQLIYDLREINPNAAIGVKLVSQAGVGTVAAGVAKANADVILISGHDGGTGASPLSSIKNTASPWELGLAETHQALVANGLRARVRLRVDGGLKTGRDVVVAAMLGADEFGFGSAALVALACVMARQCHLNTCPVGVATQREDLRARFPNDPGRLIHYLQHVSQQVRDILAQLGFRALSEIVGRTDLLVPRACGADSRRLDLQPLLIQPPPPLRGTGVPPVIHGQDGHATVSTRSVDELARRMTQDVLTPLLQGVSIAQNYQIRNINRTIGARAAGEIARRCGNHGLPGVRAEFRFTGSAGQSFGAFLTGGLRMVLEGEANDYVGKGMGGGEIVIRPPAASRFESHLNTILGNAVLYGATAGRLFAAGRAGERFCVRNSGATAVVEGVGDHGCEYMTGGTVVILGETGRNFGAGMTNGIAFVFDPGNLFERRHNPDLITIERIIEPDDLQFLRQLVFFHMEKTGSPRARQILDTWSETLLHFWKVQPRSQPNPLPRRTLSISPAETANV